MARKDWVQVLTNPIRTSIQTIKLPPEAITLILGYAYASCGGIDNKMTTAIVTARESKRDLYLTTSASSAVASTPRLTHSALLEISTRIQAASCDNPRPKRSLLKLA